MHNDGYAYSSPAGWDSRERRDPTPHGHGGGAGMESNSNSNSDSITPRQHQQRLSTPVHSVLPLHPMSTAYAYPPPQLPFPQSQPVPSYSNSYPMSYASSNIISNTSNPYMQSSNPPPLFDSYGHSQTFNPPKLDRYTLPQPPSLNTQQQQQQHIQTQPLPSYGSISLPPPQANFISLPALPAALPVHTLLPLFPHSPPVPASSAVFTLPQPGLAAERMNSSLYERSPQPPTQALSAQTPTHTHTVLHHASPQAQRPPSIHPPTPKQDAPLSTVTVLAKQQQQQGEFESASESARSTARSRRQSVAQLGAVRSQRKVSVSAAKAPSLTSESPKNAAPSITTPERHSIDPFRPIKESNNLIPHPDTTNLQDAQRTFMSTLYLTDDPDAALLPFWRCTSSKTVDIPLVNIINTPLLATGEAPLHMAAKWGKPLTMLALLKNGAAPRLRSGYTCTKFPCNRGVAKSGVVVQRAGSEEQQPVLATGRPQRKRRAAPKEFKPENTPPEEPCSTKETNQTAHCPGCFRIQSGREHHALVGKPQTALQIMFSNATATLEWVETSPPSLLKALFTQLSSSVSDQDSNGSTLLHQVMSTNNPDILEAFISALDAPALTKMSQTGDSLANTPFHIAARLANPRLLPKSLLQKLSTPGSTFLACTNLTGATPIDVCVDVAWRTITSLGLSENEVSAILATMEYSANEAVFQKQIVNLLNMPRVSSAAGVGVTATAARPVVARNKLPDSAQFLVRRLCLLAAAGAAVVNDQDDDDEDNKGDDDNGNLDASSADGRGIGSFRTLVGCRAVVKVFMGWDHRGVGATGGGDYEDRVKEVFDAAIEALYL
ncbi:hypothetical protein BJ741DRAFT_625371 [Chytriomyces cf. hyalinus JEL632]|nr:hypothetical protein BJ741DRAFT_625371 [Chytriomyces cf. hyalinus JEL632]